MKSTWKKYPNLFVNDNFRIKDVSEGRIRSPIYDIKGMSGYYYLVNPKKNQYTYIHDAVLIARPISDMTDEEWSEMKLAKLNKNQIERRKKWFKIQVLTADDLFYLLSIGVYPFDQGDFNNDDLMDLVK